MHGEVAQLNSLDPTMSTMIGIFLESGGLMLVCPFVFAGPASGSQQGP